MLVHKPSLFGVLLASLLFSSTLTGQDLTVVEVEIDRDATQLSDLLTGAALPKPEVAALLDTAMVLSSIHNTETWAYCYAKNQSGAIVGRVRVRLPAGGVRFFLASDIVEQNGFVGSVICTAAAWVIGTEVMLGVVTTDIEVHQDTRGDVSTMLFPVTAMK
ncbi:MAG TPA: hypothetical protein DCM64_01010 [Gammaproteobacteria bacterium]|jgi:hypothetical protein|nr:hypothetical protein [Gammaproteobacteria bacterium]MDP6733201.1 hypothetical protein [Gammaproteobacteria bacterium]HAJ75013.1 hypothetical protein [Gammaproteobacteria bacterium]|tara:strand:- start:160 stop:642 length:483 start_codon:yes stop_codon:yes gene_type:complete